MAAATATTIADSGFLSRERIVAKARFNRWLVPPAALFIHLCIGMAYGFSVFWLPLGRAVAAATGAAKPIACPGDPSTFGGKVAITAHALFATDCDWSLFDLGWMFTLFFVLLGVSAAIWGGWLERAGPRKAGVVAAFCWSGGLLLGAFGVYIHQLWLMWLGAGVIGGIGLGLGYISPVSTLIKWFPDRRGMATGMAIMGFGGGSMIGSPLALKLMNGGDLLNGFGAAIGMPDLAVKLPGFATKTDVGVWQTLVVMAIGYFVAMMVGALLYRVPPEGWVPPGYTPPAATTNTMITSGNVHLKNAHKTPQFWLIWMILTMNVSAGIGVIGAASQMLQETFGGRLFGDPSVIFEKFDAGQAAKAAALGGAFVGLFSLFNIAGRFFWASMSDVLGRKGTYFAFFILGIICYGALTPLAAAGALGIFAASCCIIASMYGGGFATVPAYLADMFGTAYVGAIHGRLLTAWSTAGIVGPVVVNYLHDSFKSAGIPAAHYYDTIFYVLVGMLVVGLICNILVRPVSQKWLMSDDEVARMLAERHAAAGTVEKGSFGIDKGNIFRPVSLLAWLVVGIPIIWGAWLTVLNSLKIFS